MKSRIFKTLATTLLAGLVVVNSVTPAFAANDKLTGNGKDVKNVILLISDGWGENQILATDYFTDGKAGTQIYENFPTELYMSTFAIGGEYDQADWNIFSDFKNGATDSAAAATAMSTGTKTYSGAIGVDTVEDDLTHIAEEFEELGRSTGVVTSVEFSHATPAGFVAHNVSRNNYAEIANEMIYESATDVILGCGNPEYDNSGNAVDNDDTIEIEMLNAKYVGGIATWTDLTDDNLVTGSDADGDGDDDVWTVIQTLEEFNALTTGETPDRLIGIPKVYQTLQQSRGGDSQADAYEVDFNESVPTLETMTEVALNVLDNNEEGFFLMVEGGAVDWAGHANQSGRVIEEQEDFNQAVEAVCEWVEENSSWSETLVIVTGDHETGYLTGTMGEYTLVANNGVGIMPTMEWNSGSHTNQLIPFYAKGAGAEIFKKLADQNDSVHGSYLDNTEIVDAIRALIY